MVDQSSSADQRRAERGAMWIDELVTKGRTGNPHLIRGRSGRVHLVEGRTARPVPSGIIANGLERSLGAIRNVDDAELGGFTPGIPVEVFEAEDGHAFLVIAGERWWLRGLPLAHRVTNQDASRLTRGATIDVAAANVSSRRLSQALSLRFQLDRIRTGVQRRGVLGSARTVLGRARRSLKKRSAP